MVDAGTSPVKAPEAQPPQTAADRPHPSDDTPTAGATRKNPRRRALPPGLLKRGPAAAFCSLAPNTFSRYAAAGLTPAPVKVGATLLWSRAELAEWCRRGCPPRGQWSATWKAILDRRAGGRR